MRAVKHLLAALSACAVIMTGYSAAAVYAAENDAVAEAAAVEEQEHVYTEPGSFREEELEYSLWKASDDDGEIMLSLGDANNFFTSWNGTENADFMVGEKKSTILLFTRPAGWIMKPISNVTAIISSAPAG